MCFSVDPNFAPGKIKELCGVDGGGEKRIFFIETSGEKCLKPRQACAVESAALTNPDMAVYLYFSIEAPPGKPESNTGEGLERHCRTMELLRLLPNVHIFYGHLLAKYLKGTPLEPLSIWMVLLIRVITLCNTSVMLSASPCFTSTEESI